MSRLLAALCLLAFAQGCKADEECERMRLDLAKTWGSLKESAAKRKLARVDAERWSKIEQKAETLESSFMTQRVTWQSGEKARTELIELLQGLQTDTPANLSGYTMSVDAASKQQLAFTQRCR